MPADYVGLSYESTAARGSGFLSPKNTGLIALFRLLSPTGVLRLGGNSSEFTWWKADAAAQAPTLQHPRAQPTRTGCRTHLFPSRRSNRYLAGFLDATGWKLIYGLNLGSGTPEGDAEEAAYVSKPSARACFIFKSATSPISNHGDRNGLRPPDWSFPDYLANWKSLSRTPYPIGCPMPNSAVPNSANINGLAASFRSAKRRRRKAESSRSLATTTPKVRPTILR